MKLPLAISLVLHLALITGGVITYREQRAEIRQHRRELDRHWQLWTTLDERREQLRWEQHDIQREVDDVRDRFSDHLDSLKPAP